MIDRSSLKTLRGMIIDRDKAWRADAEMGPVIEEAIRNRLKNLDEKNYNRIYEFLRYGPMGDDGKRHALCGSYETFGYDERQMVRAWKRYRKRHGIVLMPESAIH